MTLDVDNIAQGFSLFGLPLNRLTNLPLKTPFLMLLVSTVLINIFCYRWLISTSMDCTVCTWDIPSAQLVDIFKVTIFFYLADLLSSSFKLKDAHCKARISKLSDPRTPILNGFLQSSLDR